ncbi:MAG: NADH-quinone oxidoreductase subunit J [Bacteroidetes bacterium]|nr:NADH-quinone oxidoreductase subunit J [Bacteroidota bacterium]
MTVYLFYFLSFLAILCGLMVILEKNPIHSVLYLVITFFAIAGHYILLNAQFLAAVHIIVYAGAIMVLFLFVIMLLNLNKETEPHKSIAWKFAAVISAGILLIVLIGAMRTTNALPAPPHSAIADIGLVKNLGKVLFKQFLLPFEIASILFLAAMVGAVMLGKRDIK